MLKIFFLNIIIIFVILWNTLLDQIVSVLKYLLYDIHHLSVEYFFMKYLFTSYGTFLYFKYSFRRLSFSESSVFRKNSLLIPRNNVFTAENSPVVYLFIQFNPKSSQTYHLLGERFVSVFSTNPGAFVLRSL